MYFPKTLLNQNDAATAKFSSIDQYYSPFLMEIDLKNNQIECFSRDFEYKEGENDELFDYLESKCK